MPKQKITPRAAFFSSLSNEARELFLLLEKHSVISEDVRSSLGQFVASRPNCFISFHDLLSCVASDLMAPQILKSFRLINW